MPKPTKEQIENIIEYAETEKIMNPLFGYIDIDLLEDKEERSLSFLLEYYAKDFIKDIKKDPSFCVNKEDLGESFLEEYYGLVSMINRSWGYGFWEHDFKSGFKTFILDRNSFLDLAKEQLEFEF